jgi:hypothetical protein
MPKEKPKPGEPKYSEEDLKVKKFVDARIDKLKDSRKNVFGVNLESIWQQADKDYVPHTLGKKGKKMLVQNEDTGWASSRYVEMGKDEWQTDNSTPNPYIKIQTALAIMLGKNPEAVFIPGASKFEATTLLQKELYRKSWEQGKSLQQLKLFVFNLAKYGWACARTYPLILKRVTKTLINYDPENPEKNEYQTKEAVEYNGCFRENLDPFKVWIDDMTRPNNPMSTRDWVYAKDYSYDTLKEEFGSYPNFQYIKKGKSADAVKDAGTGADDYVEEDVKTAYFYENRIKDLLVVRVDGIMIVNEPLPISSTNGSKKLSLWHTYWTLRHAESPYGIGIPEASRQDQILLDKIRNMTMDQLILSIYKMFFYEGTDLMDESGVIKIRPGVGKQVINPANIKWLDVPGPGKEAWTGMEALQKNIDESTGITKPLSGDTVGKTAYESAQATEFSMKRLGTPLGNITDALEQEAYLTQTINELIYSIPEVIALSDPRKILAYMDEIKADKDLYNVNEAGEFEALVYKEMQVGIDIDKDGKLIESEKEKFFRMKPRFLKWEGMIRIKAQSLVIESKTLLKQMKLEFFNIVTPLMHDPQPELVIKPIKELCKVYDEDWQDWVPESWIEGEKTGFAKSQDLMVPQQGGGMATPQGGAPTGMTPPVAQKTNMAMPTILPKPEVGVTKGNIIGQAMGKIGKFFGGVGR